LAADATVTFDTTVDTKGFQRGTEHFGSSIERMRKTVDTISRSVDGAFGGKAQAKIESLTAKFQKQSNEIEKQQAKLAALQDDYAKLASGEAAPKSVEKMRDELDKAELALQKMSIEHDRLLLKSQKYDGMKALSPEQENEMFKVGAQIEALEHKMEAAEKKTYALDRAIKAVEMDPSVSQEAEKLAGEIESVKAKLTETEQAAGQTAEALENAVNPGRVSAFSTALEVSKNILHAITNVAGKVASGIGHIGKMAGKAFSSLGHGVMTGTKRLAQLVLGMRLFGHEARKSGNGITSFTKRISRMVQAAFVFNIIRRGLRQLTDHIGGLIAQNAQLSSSLSRIKGNLSAAFKPIWNAVLPALQAMANILVVVTGYIARFLTALSAIFGIAGKNADALKDQANATGGAGSAAQKATRQLAKFDEINQQVAEHSSGGGGGGGSLSSIFDDMKSEMEGWMKDILDAIEAGDWYKVGQVIAIKINDAIARIDWAGIGTKIGQFFQKAFEVSYGFLATIDTGKIGAGIAAAVNSAIENLNPELVGKTFGAFWNRVVDFFYGIVSTVKWDKVGDWLAGAVNGLFEEFNVGKYAGKVYLFVNGIFSALEHFITGVDWEDIGNTFGETVNNILNGIKWADILKTLGKTVKNIFVILNGFMGSINWKEIGATFSNAVNGFLGEISFVDIGTTIGKTVLSIIRLFKGFVTGLDWSSVGTSLGSAISGLFTSLSMAEDGDIGTSVSNAINGLKDLVKGLIESVEWGEIATALSGWFNNAIAGIEWSELGTTISDGILGLLTFLSTAIEETDWGALGDALWEGLKSIDWVAILNQLGELLGNLFLGLIQLISPAFVELGDWLAEKFTNLGDWIKGTVQSLFGGNEGEGSGVHTSSAGAQHGGGGFRFGEEEGQDFIDGIETGITSNASDAEQAAKFAANGIAVMFSDELGINSPSTVTKEYGGEWMEGFRIGMQDSQGAVESAVGSFLSAISDSFNAPMAEMGNLTDSTSKSIVTSFSDSAKSVKASPWAEMAAWFTTTVTQSIQAAFDGSLTTIKDLHTTAYASIKNLWKDAPTWFKTTVTALIQNAFEASLSNVKSAWANAPSWFNTNVTTPIERLFGTMATGITRILNSIISMTNSMLSKVQQGVNNAIDAINRVGFAVGPVIFNGQTVLQKVTVKPTGLSHINLGSIPGLAKGGLIQPNSPRVVMVGDNTREEEVISPVSTMKQAVLSALEDFSFGRDGFMGRNSGQLIELVLQVDGIEFGRAVVHSYNKETKRQGMRVRVAGVNP